jgi:hypothetical protein
MGEFPRKADGRRVFTPEFKRQVVQQIQVIDIAAPPSSAKHSTDP